MGIAYNNKTGEIIQILERVWISKEEAMIEFPKNINDEIIIKDVFLKIQDLNKEEK